MIGALGRTVAGRLGLGLGYYRVAVEVRDRVVASRLGLGYYYRVVEVRDGGGGLRLPDSSAYSRNPQGCSGNSREYNDIKTCVAGQLHHLPRGTDGQ